VQVKTEFIKKPHHYDSITMHLRTTIRQVLTSLSLFLLARANAHVNLPPVFEVHADRWTADKEDQHFCSKDSIQEVLKWQKDYWLLSTGVVKTVA